MTSSMVFWRPAGQAVHSRDDNPSRDRTEGPIVADGMRMRVTSGIEAVRVHEVRHVLIDRVLHALRDVAMSVAGRSEAILEILGVRCEPLGLALRPVIRALSLDGHATREARQGEAAEQRG
jgi:hypothetical protein